MPQPREATTSLRPGVRDRRSLGELDLPVRRLRSQHSFVLDDPATVWMVSKGTAALYSVRVEQDVVVGPRQPLFQVGVGDGLFAVFATEATALRLLVSAATETLELVEVPLGRLGSVCAETGIPVAQVAGQWVTRWARFFAEQAGPGATRTIAPGERATLEPEQLVGAVHDGLVWVRLEAGAARLWGGELAVRPGLDPLPLAFGMRLQALEPLTLTASDAAGLDDDAWLRGLALLHRLVADYLAVLDERQRSELRRRDEVQVDAQQRKFQGALATMTSVLEPQPAPLREQAPLLSVVTVVGEALGIAIRPPPAHLLGGDVSSLSLQAICRASQVRYRSVLLRGEWWKTDCGPLVGRLQEDRRPVALLRSGNRYEIVDPQSGTRTPVDRQSSGRLTHTASMLYPGLPDGLERVAGLLKFSLKDQVGDVAFVFGVAMFGALLGMLTPQAVAMVMDTAIPDANERLLVELALVLIAAACGRAVFELAQGMVSIRVAVNTESRAQPALWDRLLNLRAAFFQRYTSGDLLSRVMAVREISKTLNGATLRSLLSGTMALLNLGLLFYYSARLAIIALVFGLGVAAVTVLSGFFLRRYNNERIALEGGFFGFVVQLINATGKIRSAGAERRVFAVWAKRYARQLTLVRKTTSVQNGMFVVNQVVPTVSLILLFWFGAGLLEDIGGATAGQPLSLGVFLAFSVAMAVFIAGVTALSNTLLDAIDIVTYGRRLEPLLRADQEVQASKVDPGQLSGEIALSHVYFSYSEQGPTVLRDVSIQAQPGEFVALVGTSGSGKTTVFRLLLGFDVPQAGAITFDGRDSNGLDITAVRRQMGIVLQSVRISSGSLLECIGAGQPIPVDKAWQIAEDVGLAEDIRAMPMGMHTFLSEGAVSLSGGQRQRLLIARALAHEPRILLMDEATSALDNRTQATVSASLRRRKVTRLVIAHRLSTVQDADRIYVLDRGQIVQVGTSSELMKQDGVFAALMARQIA